MTPDERLKVEARLAYDRKVSALLILSEDPAQQLVARWLHDRVVRAQNELYEMDLEAALGRVSYRKGKVVSTETNGKELQSKLDNDRRVAARLILSDNAADQKKGKEMHDLILRSQRTLDEINAGGVRQPQSEISLGQAVKAGFPEQPVLEQWSGWGILFWMAYCVAVGYVMGKVIAGVLYL